MHLLNLEVCPKLYTVPFEQFFIAILKPLNRISCTGNSVVKVDVPVQCIYSDLIFL